MTNSHSRALLVLGASCALTMALSGSSFAQTSQACASAKQKALGKAASGAFNCYSTAQKLDVPVDPACLQKVKDKWTLPAKGAFEKAELKGGCALEAQNILYGGTDAGEAQGLFDLAVDQTNVPAEGITDQVVPTLVTCAINACQATKMKEAGKAAAKLLGCHSKASKSDVPVAQSCLDKVTSKMASAYAKAEAKGGCTTTGDATTVTAALGTFVEKAVQGTPRNDGCGSGFVLVGESCDDGNKINTDDCPSNCTIAACVPTAGVDQWSVDFTGTKDVGAIRIFVDYPEGKLSIPGSGAGTLAAAFDNIVGGFTTTASFNDRDHGVTSVLVDGTGVAPAFGMNGTLFTVDFNTCTGAPAAAPGDFTCTVIDAADPLAKPITGITCSVN